MPRWPDQVDFVIIAGDLYDVGLKSFGSALFFNRQMTRLKEAGIDVYLIHGNHDAASKLIKQLRPPANVHVFRSNEPQTFRRDVLHLPVAIHGQSFATPEVTDDLAANYPPPIANAFNIGVLHTNLSGISEHANYAPCSLDTLRNKGYQYWALGHVHNRQIFCSDPYIVFPGNIQGRHGKEPGEKSCELVTVSDAGAVSIETIPTSVLLWSEVEIDASDCQTVDDLYDKLPALFGKLVSGSHERVTALRVRIAGSSEAHTELNRDPEVVRNEVMSLASEFGNGLLWIERVQVATAAPINPQALLTRDDPVGEVMRALAALREDPPRAADWEGIAELKKRLPKEGADDADPIVLDVRALATAIDEAEALLLARHRDVYCLPHDLLHRRANVRRRHGDSHSGTKGFRSD
jgi:DNA repair exonuclease SbcCD nuclease subunit